MKNFRKNIRTTQHKINVESYNFDGYKPADIAVDVVTSIASVCYQSNSGGSKRLYNMLLEENHHLPSSAFEFIPVTFNISIEYFVVKALNMGIPCNVYKYGYKYGDIWITNLRALYYDHKSGLIPETIYESMLDNKIVGSENKYFINNINMYTFGQLVRHRDAQMQVQSRRYTSNKKSQFSFNCEASNNKEEVLKYCNDMVSQYSELLEKGDKKEVARGIIPQFATTKIWFGFNSPHSRENFMNIRLTKKAQDEIRGLAEVLKAI